MADPYDQGEKNPMSVLGPTLRFKGELSAKEDLLIQGQIDGTIKHTSKLTIGDKGKLKANVAAEFISVEGEVVGDLVGSKSVGITQSANVSGNIYSPTVTLHEGATFNGRIDMSGKPPADEKQPPNKIPASKKVTNDDESAQVGAQTAKSA